MAAFIFAMRSTPSSGSMHRRDQSSGTGTTLPVISEDSDSFIANRAPPVPPRASNRPEHKPFRFAPPGLYHERSPPAYNPFDYNTVEGPNGEKLQELRKGLGNNKHIAKRGGWKRLVLIALVVIAIIVALGVGLGIGLKKRNNSSSSNSASSDSSASGAPAGSAPGGASGNVEPDISTTDTPANATFPIGSYSFHTYLSTIAANCTSNPATWMCYPYSTYAESAADSDATFDWIIRQAPDSTNYTISSTENVFSILFSNTSLTLMKAGQPDEHYFFQLSMSKPTKPTQQLGSDNVAATCYFNDTTFQGYLYTKMKKTYPKDESTHEGGFDPWPYAVKIEQVKGASQGMPECKDPSGKSLGDFGVEDGTQLCDCLYLNTGT